MQQPKTRRLSVSQSKNMTGAHPSQSSIWKPTPEMLKIWKRHTGEKPADPETIQSSFCHHATTTLARSSFNMDPFAAYEATAYSVRDRLLDRWNFSQQLYTLTDPKRVYYLSLEFLLGRSLDNALLNLQIKLNYSTGLSELGFRLEDFISQETDAALGNGGLGRLAACFMDSMATLNMPAWGYGIRYNYGIFKQNILDGYQTEFPDYWLNFGNPWEIARLDVFYEVKFRGFVNKVLDSQGQSKHVWEGGEKVLAVAYDYPIPGYNTQNTINIRLWSSKPTREFDFASFNDGNYEKSVAEQTNAENITSVLYPNDNHMVGKILRLKQQFFFVSATLQDIIRRFKKNPRPFSEFPDQVAIQLNDTHPTLGIPELMRLLVDEENVPWDEAWGIVTRVYSFTNHTVLPEAMEKWPVPIFQDLLPRHLMIIFDINLFFLQGVENKYPGDRERLRRMSIIEEGHPQYVRMAFLAVVGSHTVNGVAALHSHLIKTTVFHDFVDYYGEDKFTNVTNGVTPRRWLNQSNPQLSELISSKLKSDKWLTDSTKLSMLKSFSKDPAFQDVWMDIKHQNKIRLAHVIKELCGIEVSPDALFDVHCKRIHEYKRQFMNILAVIHRYNTFKKLSPTELAKQVPRVVIFSGKAAPGYYIAKLMIKLINNVGATINDDAVVSPYLKCVFIPNYNVSLAEIIIPASDISQHISTAGTEASGTSNMKFVLNGGLILGTVDGANIEIREEIGEENIWLFGALTAQVDEIRHEFVYRRNPVNPDLDLVMKSIRSNDFGDANVFEPLLTTLSQDYYIISSDFEPYLNANNDVDATFKNKRVWAEKSINAAAGMGMFSSDRSILEYANRIWNIKSLKI